MVNSSWGAAAPSACVKSRLAGSATRPIVIAPPVFALAEPSGEADVPVVLDPALQPARARK